MVFRVLAHGRDTAHSPFPRRFGSPRSTSPVGGHLEQSVAEPLAAADCPPSGGPFASLVEVAMRESRRLRRT